MPRGKSVPITKEVLKWAIDESGYTLEEVAERIGIGVPTLRAWIGGSELPKLTEFKHLSNLLKRPTATFFLPEPPRSTIPRVEFRHPPSVERAHLNPKELQYLREASRLQRFLSWILKELGNETLSLPKVSMKQDAEDVAREFRARLGVTVGQQVAWENASGAFKGWRNVLQDSGALVFLFSLGKNSCQGFSVWDGYAPLIAINTHWNNEARIFTLFHEYAHLLTRTNSACFGHSRGFISITNDQTERWCERFSASMILPWEAVTGFLMERFEWTASQQINDLDIVRAVARHFKVSLRATTLRLIEYQVATWDLYSQIPAWVDDKSAGRGSGGRRRQQIKEDTYGNRATNIFVKALSEDVVSRMDVLRYLDVADSDLDKFQSQMIPR